MVALLMALESQSLEECAEVWPAGVVGASARQGPRSVAVAMSVDTGRTGDELDPHVLRRAKAGDRDAFVELMDHYDRCLRSLAYRLLDDREATVDAMQDVYVKAFGALPGFRERSSVGTWLYRITYTTCCAALRKRKRQAVEHVQDDPPVDGLTRDPADEAALHADLAAALRSLSPEARAAVLLVDRDGYDYRTAASVLGIPAGTLASRLSAAHAVLRRALGAGGRPS